MLQQLKAMYGQLMQPPENQPYAFASIRALQECVRQLDKRVQKLHLKTKKFANTLLARDNPEMQPKGDKIEVKSFEDVIF